MTKRRKNIEISEVVIQPIQQTSKGLIAYISFVYNNELKINDCQIITRPSGGFRILYPLKPLSNTKFVSVVFPISKEIGQQLEEKLLQEYANFLGKFGVKYP